MCHVFKWLILPKEMLSKISFSTDFSENVHDKSMAIQKDLYPNRPPLHNIEACSAQVCALLRTATIHSVKFITPNRLSGNQDPHNNGAQVSKYFPPGTHTHLRYLYQRSVSRGDISLLRIRLRISRN